jgi:protease-4
MILASTACLLGTLLPILASDDTVAPAKAQRLVTVDLSKIGDEDPAPTSPFGSPKRNFLAELDRLRAIAADPEVAAIRLEPGHSLDSARALDVLRELRALHDAGKKIVCYAEGLDRRSLWFASTADLLMVPAWGGVELAAPSAEVLYMKELLGKVGVRFEVIHIGEFKTAFEDMARDSMSEPQRVEMTALLKQQYESCVETIAKNRDVEPAKVEAGFEKILLQPQEALDLGLIDAIGYEDEFDARVEQLLGTKAEEVKDYGEAGKDELMKKLDSPFAIFTLLQEVMEPKKKELPDTPRIAIVYASGGITSGKSSTGFNGQTMGADTIVEALDAAREDAQVKAVVFRINSPGGSALASDLIWRAVQRCREQKPVIASMGGVAASGGYWIAMGCDRILAQPSTITGSIGVVAAVPNLTELFAKAGVKVEVVGYGPHAEELSTMRDGLPPVMRARIESMMQAVYGEFVAKAAKGRKLDPVALEKHARGRVWAGKEAKEIGLIDGLGGLRDAITYACFVAKLDAKTTPIRELPEAPDFFEQLQEQFGDLVTLRAPLARVAEQLGGVALVRAIAPFLEPARPGERVKMLATLPYVLNER